MRPKLWQRRPEKAYRVRDKYLAEIDEILRISKNFLKGKLKIPV